MAGWLFILRAERLDSVQSELDIDVRTAMERLKAELRLSSMDEIAFHPAGIGPYTAISFPLACDSDGDGLIEMDGAGTNIYWDKTVVYHVWTGTPYRLLRTVFDRRTNTLTAVQRQAQIDYVVLHGEGASTYEGASAHTESVFENLFQWSIWGKGAVCDCYSPTLERVEGLPMGAALLTNGMHDFKFACVGKNAASTGYRIGVDSVVASPCGGVREAEAQLPVRAQSGASAGLDYMAEGAWSGNYQLLFPATAVGHYFTLGMENDRWEETNFRAKAAVCDRTVVEFNTSLNPMDYVMRLEGLGYTWLAEDQTGSASDYSDTTDGLTNCAVRVLLRGERMEQGGWLSYHGRAHYVCFMSAAGATLRIKSAYVSEAASMTNLTMNAADSGIQLFFDGSPSCPGTTIYNSYAWAWPLSPYEIDRSKSYVLSFDVEATAGSGNARYWPESRVVGTPGCYVLCNPAAGDVRTPNWVAKGAFPTNRLFAVYGVYTTYPTNGVFTSQAFDTQRAAPQYQEMLWNADKPSGTSLRLKVRTGSDENMSDALPWGSVAAMTSPGAISPEAKRYVQFQVLMNPDGVGWATPRLRDAAIRWQGETKVTDIASTLTRGPNYGIVEMTVDGRPLTKGLTIDLTIYEDVVGLGTNSHRLTSSMIAEVEPRNTGK
jgi:hypothetical protein